MKYQLIFPSLVAMSLAACHTAAPDLDKMPAPNGPSVYRNSFSEMPKAWVDSAMERETVLTPNAPVAPNVGGPSQPAAIPKADLPYGTPVPGKDGLVQSPYSSQGYVDIRGMPPGTMAKCPYTGKVFLVP